MLHGSSFTQAFAVVVSSGCLPAMIIRSQRWVQAVGVNWCSKVLEIAWRWRSSWVSWAFSEGTQTLWRTAKPILSYSHSFVLSLSRQFELQSLQRYILRHLWKRCASNELSGSITTYLLCWVLKTYRFPETWGCGHSLRTRHFSNKRPIFYYHHRLRPTSCARKLPIRKDYGHERARRSWSTRRSMGHPGCSCGFVFHIVVLSCRRDCDWFSMVSHITLMPMGGLLTPAGGVHIMVSQRAKRHFRPRRSNQTRQASLKMTKTMRLTFRCFEPIH